MKEKEEDKNNKDIFQQAAEESMKGLIKKEPEEIEEVEAEEISQEEIAISRTEEPIDPAWNKVEKAMNGELSEKFLRVMKELPDRDFVRVYLKTLEYFKPKVVREEREDNKKEDTKIEVTVMHRNDDGDIVELQLNKKNNTYE